MSLSICWLSSFVQLLQRGSRTCLSYCKTMGGHGNLCWRIRLKRGNWVLVYCKVSSNSVERFHRSQKCLGQSEARMTISIDWSTWKTSTGQITLNTPVKLRRNPFKQWQRRRQVENERPMQSETRAVIFVGGSARKSQTWQRTWSTCLPSSFIRFRFAVAEKSKPATCKGGHLCRQTGKKHTQTWLRTVSASILSKFRPSSVLQFRRSGKS